MDDLFTDVEVQAIILAVGRGQETFTEDDLKLAFKWARDQRIRASLLELVLSGHLSLNFVDDEDEPKFCRVPEVKI